MTFSFIYWKSRLVVVLGDGFSILRSITDPPITFVTDMALTLTFPMRTLHDAQFARSQIWFTQNIHSFCWNRSWSSVCYERMDRLEAARCAKDEFSFSQTFADSFVSGTNVTIQGQRTSNLPYPYHCTASSGFPYIFENQGISILFPLIWLWHVKSF